MYWSYNTVLLTYRNKTHKRGKKMKNGIQKNFDGTYTAITYGKRKTFVSLRSAEEWMYFMWEDEQAK